MKLNFWQWLGVGLLVAGLILVIARKANHGDAQPTTHPTTAQTQ